MIIGIDGGNYGTDINASRENNDEVTTLGLVGGNNVIITIIRVHEISS